MGGGGGGWGTECIVRAIQYAIWLTQTSIFRNICINLSSVSISKNFPMDLACSIVESRKRPLLLIVLD